MIVTLAGHVDHGKTTLVRLLTGTDTDRLAEEKRRGLTIDLGFAYLHDGATTVGFVDVPGHHRFIHNMVAGVASMQQALLVIAADDGPMPQSHEHLQILELLGLSDGVVALSKCDRVSPRRLERVRQEIADLVAGSFLQTAPVIETRGAADAGLDELRALLLARARAHAAAQLEGPFRLAVDRAFVLRGTGLVVTGTVHAGRVAVNDELHAFPAGSRLRVRELRVQNQPATEAVCGDRAALGLGGDAGALARGHWLTGAPDAGSTSVVVELRMLRDFPRNLRHWSPVHVYHATSHATARLALLQGARLAPAQRTRAEVILDTPLAVKHGDRLVLRDAALERTVGGGLVIDNRPAAGRRRAPVRLAAIDACAHERPEVALDALLALGAVRIPEFLGLWNLSAESLDAMLRERNVIRLADEAVDRERWQSWSDVLARECTQRLATDTTRSGLRENEFASPVPARFLPNLLAELVSRGALTRHSGLFRPPHHEVHLDPFERNLLDRLKPLLDQPQPPSTGDLARSLKQPLAMLQKSAKALAGKGALVLVNDRRLYLPGRVDELADVAQRLSEKGPFTARDYRDAAGIGRNVAIDMLEFFDARGFTRRQGDTRTVVGERSRLAPTLG